jgi:aldose 1-epimerase
MTLFAALLCGFVSCGTKKETSIPDTFPLIDKSAYDCEVDGKKVSLYTLHAGNITMQVTNYGARVVSLWAPDKDGKHEDVVIGYDSISKYLRGEGERFLGCVVGRYANRIAKGTFDLNGKSYHLPINNNGQTLHGGNTGLDRVVWDVEQKSDSVLCLKYTSPDGSDGFPGNLTIEMTYSLSAENEFRIDYKAITDAPTYINLSNHAFFNLKGEGNGTITDHLLTINGEHIIPVDSVLIPTGEIAPVEGTPFDFREATTIGARIAQDCPQLKNGNGYDVTWVLDGQEGELYLAAILQEPQSGRAMEVWTDQPGIQFYSGNFFDGSGIGKHGQPIRFREALALETQHFPDSPHHPNFPSTLLNPGEEYHQTCIYKFGVK